MLRTFGLLLAAFATLAACSAPPVQTFVPPPPAVYAAPQVPARQTVEVEDDRFKPDIVFRGIETSTSSQTAGFRSPAQVSRNYFIRSWLPRNGGQPSHQIYVSDLYRDYSWRFWNRANDDHARPLRFVSIDREVITCSDSICSFSEDFGIAVADSTLRARRGREYCVKAFASNGSEALLCLSPQQIDAQLAAIDAHRAMTRSRRSTSPRG